MDTNPVTGDAQDVCNVFVARQPVMDRRGRAVAYELLFRDSDTGAACINDDVLCTAAVIERAIGAIGMDRLLEGKKAFLNCSADFLYSRFVDVLPADRFVLEILESCELTPRLAERCVILRQAGFTIALDDVREIAPAIRGFLPAVDIVKLDWPFIDKGSVGEMIAELKTAGKAVLAEKVETRVECDLALSLGCDLLQGYFFAKPTIMAARKSMPPVDSVLKIFNLITQEAPQSLVAQALNDTPMLVAQLLRLANSSSQSHNRTTKVSSVNQALAMAGSERLLQWCGLLLYANPDGLPVTEDPLALLAGRRAIFMGQAVLNSGSNSQSMVDSAFLTGMLSLLPIACGMDATAFFRSVAVSDEIRTAILGHQGMLGELLDATEHVENAEPHKAKKLFSSRAAPVEDTCGMPAYY